MIQLINELEKHNISISLNGDDLELRLGEQDPEPELIQKIRDHKQELIAFLKKYSSERTSHAILPVEQREKYPVSYAQKRLWILSQFEGGSVVYNMPKLVEMPGVYDVDLFIKSVYAVIDRHEVLRTVFKEDENGDLSQYILKTSELDFSIQFTDLRKETNSQRLVNAYREEDSYQPFDLENGPLLRAHLFQVADNHYTFYYNMHHIISDGWSLEIMMQDVIQYYQAFITGQTAALQPLQIQYKDYASWQLEQMTNGQYNQSKEYWLEKLSGSAPIVELPTMKSRPKIKTYNGHALSTNISTELTRGLRRFVQAQGGSLFIHLLAAWNVLLHRYTAQKDIIIGTPVAGRGHSDLENQIGFYINTLALRNQIDPKENYLDFYEKVKISTLQDFSNQMYPFDSLVEELNIERDVSRNPLFDIMLTLHNIKVDASDSNVEELSISDEIVDFEVTTIPKLDLDIDIHENEHHLTFNMVYNTDIYERETIELLIIHFKQMLTKLLEDPTTAIEKIDYLSDWEVEELTRQFNDTFVDYPNDVTILDFFEEQVASKPNAVAVLFKNDKLTYKELDEKAGQLAQYLNAQGVGRESMVPICLERSIEMVVGIWGILKAGAAYVPIDPHLPTERIAYMLDETEATIVLSASANSPELGAREKIDLDTFDYAQYSSLKLENKVEPSDAAYVIYTSGTTGQPKGVVNEHDGLLNRLLWMRDYLDIKTSDLTLQKTPFTFDVSVWELVLPFITGSSLLMAIPEGHKDPQYLQETIATRAVNIIHFVPSMFRIYLSHMEAEQNKSLRHIICSGEELPLNLVTDFKSHQLPTRLHNLYGPTEAAIDVTAKDLTTEVPEKGVSLGKPVANTEILITNEFMQLQPKGVVGELLIGGVQVARGYLKKESLTKEKFISNPFKEKGRLYKTGDLAMWDYDGEVRYMGRKDDQVKIRGNRIELGEIEYHLRKHEGIHEAVVMVIPNSEGEKEIVAYLMFEQVLNAADLREYLLKAMPPYMIPTRYKQLDDIPLNQNGKVDRSALRRMETLEIPTGVAYQPPTNEVEMQLVEIWQTVLNRDKIGIHDEFFHIGGDSIKAMKIISEIQKSFEVSINMVTVFKEPTIKSLAEIITNQSWYSNEAEGEKVVDQTLI